MVVLQLAGRAVVRTLAVFVLMLIRARRTVLIGLGVLAVGWILLANATRLPVVGSMLAVGGSGGTAAPARDVRTTRATGLSGEPVPSVESYITGLTQFDAKMMWGSLSEEAISAMMARGGSLEALQSGLDDAKRRGARYEDITMIGTYPLQDGRKYLFYVLSRRGFSGADQLEQVYFVFTVNSAGKITRIE